MTDLDLDAIEAAHDRTCTFCGNGATCTNAALVAALREARAEVAALASVADMCCGCPEPCQTSPDRSSLRAERDDLLRRYEALHDGVTGLCDDPHAHYHDARRWVAVTALRAVVARVEGDES